MIRIVIFYALGLLFNVNFFDWKFYIFHSYSILALLCYYGNSKIRYYTFYIFYACAYMVAAVTCWPCLLSTTFPVPSRNPYHAIIFFVNPPLKIKWVKKNTQILKNDESAVLVANHQSIMDTLGSFQLFDEVPKMSPLIKKSLFYVPIFGLFSYIAGCLFIDRSNPASAKKTLETARDYIVRGKRTLYIYPEGTRNDSGTLLPFKKGAFRTAIDAQVPIIPLVYSPFYFIDHKKKTLGEGEVTMSVLEPIPTTGLTPEDTEKLMAITHDRMSLEYEKLKQLKH